MFSVFISLLLLLNGLGVSAQRENFWEMGGQKSSSFSDLTAEPTLEPTREPTLEPTREPTLEPTAEPTLQHASVEPTVEPTLQPTIFGTIEPTSEPIMYPTLQPIFVVHSNNIELRFTVDIVIDGVDFTQYSTDPTASSTLATVMATSISIPESILQVQVSVHALVYSANNRKMIESARKLEKSAFLTTITFRFSFAVLIEQLGFTQSQSAIAFNTLSQKIQDVISDSTFVTLLHSSGPSGFSGVTVDSTIIISDFTIALLNTLLPTIEPTTLASTSQLADVTPDVNACISITVADLLGDGWDTANLIIYPSRGQHVRYTPSCANNPMTLSFCFDSAMNKDGDYVVVSVAGYSPLKPWEIYWSVYSSYEDKSYVGNYETSMTFTYSSQGTVSQPVISLTKSSGSVDKSSECNSDSTCSLVNDDDMVIYDKNRGPFSLSKILARSSKLTKKATATTRAKTSTASSTSRKLERKSKTLLTSTFLATASSTSSFSYEYLMTPIMSTSTSSSTNINKIIFGTEVHISTTSGGSSSSGNVLIYSSKLCPRNESSVCTVNLKDGEYSLAVTGGLDDENNNINSDTTMENDNDEQPRVTWSFCDVQGYASSELIFKIQDGACSPISLKTTTVSCVVHTDENEMGDELMGEDAETTSTSTSDNKYKKDVKDLKSSTSTVKSFYRVSKHDSNKNSKNNNNNTNGDDDSQEQEDQDQEEEQQQSDSEISSDNNSNSDNNDNTEPVMTLLQGVLEIDGIASEAFSAEATKLLTDAMTEEFEDGNILYDLPDDMTVLPYVVKSSTSTTTTATSSMSNKHDRHMLDEMSSTSTATSTSTSYVTRQVSFTARMMMLSSSKIAAKTVNRHNIQSKAVDEDEMRNYIQKSMTSGLFITRVRSLAHRRGVTCLKGVSRISLVDLHILHETVMNKEMSLSASIIVVGSLFIGIFISIMGIISLSKRLRNKRQVQQQQKLQQRGERHVINNYIIAPMVDVTTHNQQYVV
eukprot:gene2904-5699_t